MRQILPHHLWLGNAPDVWDLKHVLDRNIKAIVDLAANEKPPTITRDVVYCRVPLIDNAGNPPWLVRLAVHTVASLLRERVNTLVFCSAGMSRSPAIIAGAIAWHTGSELRNALESVVAGAAHDVSPGLIADVQRALQSDA